MKLMEFVFCILYANILVDGEKEAVYQLDFNS